MGYMRHHAILVTSWKIKHDTVTEAPNLKLAHKKAREIFGKTVTPIIKSPVNGYGTFMVAPDGSKEGWTDSAAGDDRRAAFIKWLDEHRYDDGSSSFDWVEVQYGDDEGATFVVAHNDEEHRQKAKA